MCKFSYSCCASYTECNLLLTASIYFLFLYLRLSRFMCVFISFLCCMFMSVCLSLTVSVSMGLTWNKHIDSFIDWLICAWLCTESVDWMKSINRELLTPTTTGIHLRSANHCNKSASFCPIKCIHDVHRPIRYKRRYIALLSWRETLCSGCGRWRRPKTK